MLLVCLTNGVVLRGLIILVIFCPSISKAVDISSRYGGQQIIVELTSCHESLRLDLKRKVRSVKIRGRLRCARDLYGNPEIMVTLSGGGYALQIDSRLWIKMSRINRRYAISVGNIYVTDFNARSLNVLNQLKLIAR